MPGSRIHNPSTSGMTVTIAIKPVKATCPENQEALDRLQERLVKAQSNPNSQFVHTLRRGMVSLRECRYPLMTQKQACELKNIGPALARIILPTNSSAEQNLNGTSTGGTTSNAPKKVVVAKATERPHQQEQQFTKAAESIVKASPSIQTTAKEKAYDQAKRDAERLVLPPKGPWKVVLVIDARERQSQQVVSHCKQSGIPCEERTLPIGDMAWIAQCVQPKTKGMSSQSKPIEIMVGTIIERKEVSDLACSLYGTRYSEQRLRLSQCGLPQVLFLVEGDITQVANCPSETLQMAMMETRVLSGFQVIQTKHLNETTRVLKGLHRRIVQRTFPEAFDKNTGVSVPTYVNHPNETGRHHGTGSNVGRRRNRRPSSLLEMVFDSTPIPPFGASRFITYAELKAKVELDRERGTKSVQAITMAMLKQIPSLSEKKCTAIAEKYPTMNRLIETLCYHEGRPECVVSSITTGRQTIGPKSASEVFAACCTLGDGSLAASHNPTTKTHARTRATSTTIQAKDLPAKKASTAATVIQTDRNAKSEQTTTLTKRSNPQCYDSLLGGTFSTVPLGSFTSRKRPPTYAVDATLSTSAMDRYNYPSFDMSGWSSSAASTAVFGIKRAKNTNGTSNDMLGPSLNETQLKWNSCLKIQSTKDISQDTAANTTRGATTDQPAIDSLDSDWNKSLVVVKVEVCREGAVNGFKQEMQEAIPYKMLETVTSTFSTNAIPPSAKDVSRKISTESSSGEKRIFSSNTDRVDGRGTFEASSLRKGVISRHDNEVIEIDL
jgi:ERCC4-type nuclease